VRATTNPAITERVTRRSIAHIMPEHRESTLLDGDAIMMA
jgi:hypothetical protein